MAGLIRKPARWVNRQLNGSPRAIPAPPANPELIDLEAEALGNEAAALAARKRARKRRGFDRQATLLTSPTGLQDAAPTRRPTLWGS